MKTDADLLIVRSGGGLDYQKGILHDVTEDVVRFDLDGKVLPAKRAKVFGLVYHHGAAVAMPSPICRITDAAGSLWLVRSLSLGEKLRELGVQFNRVDHAKLTADHQQEQYCEEKLVPGNVHHGDFLRNVSCFYRASLPAGFSPTMRRAKNRGLECRFGMVLWNRTNPPTVGIPGDVNGGDALAGRWFSPNQHG